MLRVARSLHRQNREKSSYTLENHAYLPRYQKSLSLSTASTIPLIILAVSLIEVLPFELYPSIFAPN